MLESFKTLLKKHLPTQNDAPKEKAVIITIHGYGRRRKHEMDNLALWAKQDPALAHYEILQFDLYDLFDDTDCNWHQWVGRAKSVINEQELLNRSIYLVGFSMGGVIAAYLAATSAHVKKLILLAPAFQYWNKDAIASAITKQATSIFNSDGKADEQDITIPRTFYTAFTDVIRHCKPYIEKVMCPVLLLHGDIDEVISVKSSIYAYDKIPHKQKKLILLHNGHHRLLMDEAVNWEVYQIIRLFINGDILGDDEIPQAPDILEEYRKQNKKQTEASIRDDE